MQKDSKIFRVFAMFSIFVCLYEFQSISDFLYLLFILGAREDVKRFLEVIFKIFASIFVKF